MLGRALALLLICPLALVAPLPRSRALDGPEVEVDDDTAAAEVELLDATAALRRDHHSPPLERNSATGFEARDYSRAMASAHEVRHGPASHPRAGPQRRSGQLRLRREPRAGAPLHA